jgi:archaellum component FlaC
MNIKELLQELKEQKEQIQKDLKLLKTRYEKVTDNYDALQVKYLIGYYEGQEDIISQILDYYK